MDHAHAYLIHGPTTPEVPLVLDSPHSGHHFPADFRAALADEDLREGEDVDVDMLCLPAAGRGIPLLAAQFPRTYLDPNRHAGDIDLELLEGGHWPHELQPSGKAGIGKALLWRTLDDGRPIYDRRLGVDEVRARILRFHAPYHQALRRLLDAAHARFGIVAHINCHSMNAVSGSMSEGGAGQSRADFVLGDRDGTSCDPALTDAVRATLTGLGYEVKVNDPFKGVELVRAYADPATGRHSLQVEINKRLYLHGNRGARLARFGALQQHLLAMLETVLDFTGRAPRHG
jgi:N-formylglutamate amidohydrolase